MGIAPSGSAPLALKLYSIWAIALNKLRKWHKEPLQPERELGGPFNKLNSGFAVRRGLDLKYLICFTHSVEIILSNLQI